MHFLALLALAQVAITAPIVNPTGTITTLAPTGSVPSGYVQASGTSFVASGKSVALRGVNLGGWRVIEDWMCGITDSKDNTGNQPGRNSRKTLTDRFGVDAAGNLLKAWESNFINSQDFVTIKHLGFNVVRIGFSYLTLQYADGAWRDDAFTMLDWAVQQAKANDLYVILSFHAWETMYEDYSLISENTNEGAAARGKAQAVWQYVAKHYKGESTIAAFDMMNEPTGSYANNLQQALYSAIRSVDPDRVILLESFDADPQQYAFHQVAYSFHNYDMASADQQKNKDAWGTAQTPGPVQSKAKSLLGHNIPVYMGEFRVSGDTVKFLIDGMNALGLSYSMWTYKAVDQGDWAFYNFPHSTRVNLDSDSYDSILHAWQGMGQTPATANTGLMQQYGIHA